jgi:hypothetical protein
LIVQLGPAPWYCIHVPGIRMLLNPAAFTASSCAVVTVGLPQEVSPWPVASNVLPRFQPGCIAATTARGFCVGGCDEDPDCDGPGLDGPGPDGLPGPLGSGRPLQVVPFSVKEVGAVLLPLNEPWKPNSALPLVGTAAL